MIVYFAKYFSHRTHHILYVFETESAPPSLPLKRKIKQDTLLNKRILGCERHRDISDIDADYQQNGNVKLEHCLWLTECVGLACFRFKRPMSSPHQFLFSRENKEVLC